MQTLFSNQIAPVRDENCCWLFSIDAVIDRFAWDVSFGWWNTFDVGYVSRQLGSVAAARHCTHCRAPVGLFLVVLSILVCIRCRVSMSIHTYRALLRSKSAVFSPNRWVYRYPEVSRQILKLATGNPVVHAALDPLRPTRRRICTANETPPSYQYVSRVLPVTIRRRVALPADWPPIDTWSVRLINTRTAHFQYNSGAAVERVQRWKRMSSGIVKHSWNLLGLILPLAI